MILLVILKGAESMFDQCVFGKRLKEFRVKRNLTQRETALKIGVSEQAISKWENGGSHS